MTLHFRRANGRSMVLSAALVLGALAPCWAQGWKSFSPAGAGFSVSLPGTPKSERNVSKDEDGTQTTDQDYELESASMLLKIGYQEHDAQFARLINTSNLLDEVTQAALKAMGGAASRAKPRQITLDGFEGRDVSTKIAEDGQQSTIRLRVFWAGRRLYMQMAAFSDSATDKAGSSRFIDSLKLLKPQPK